MNSGTAIALGCVILAIVMMAFGLALQAGTAGGVGLQIDVEPTPTKCRDRLTCRNGTMTPTDTPTVVPSDTPTETPTATATDTPRPRKTTTVTPTATRVSELGTPVMVTPRPIVLQLPNTGRGVD